MERDRELSLLRQAHFEGYLDCEKVRFFDRKWWLKARWAMNWVERRNRNEVRKLHHELNASLLDYFTGDRALDLHWEQGETIQNRVAKALIPWEKHGKQRFSRRKFNELVGLWTSVWGDPTDPKTKQKIDYTAAELNRLAEQGGRVNGRQSVHP